MTKKLEEAVCRSNVRLNMFPGILELPSTNRFQLDTRTLSRQSATVRIPLLLAVPRMYAT